MEPQVGIIMGSDSDWDTVAPAAEILVEFGIAFEVGVVSRTARRTRCWRTPRRRTPATCR